MGVSRTVSEMDGDFSRKSHFPTRRVFNAPPPEWVPHGIEYPRWGQKKTRMMNYQAEQEV